MLKTKQVFHLQFYLTRIALHLLTIFSKESNALFALVVTIYDLQKRKSKNVIIIIFSESMTSFCWALKNASGKVAPLSKFMVLAHLDDVQRGSLFC